MNTYAKAVPSSVTHFTGLLRDMSLYLQNSITCLTLYKFEKKSKILKIRNPWFTLFEIHT